MHYEYEVSLWFEYLDAEKQCAYEETYVYRSPQRADAKCGRLQNPHNLKNKKVISVSIHKLECCDRCGEWWRRANDYSEYFLMGEEPVWTENNYPSCKCFSGKVDAKLN